MKCLGCGCTDEQACPGGCAWIRAGHPVCTRCIDKAAIELPVGRRVELLQAAGGARKGVVGEVVELEPSRPDLRWIEVPVRVQVTITALKGARKEKSRG